MMMLKLFQDRVIYPVVLPIYQLLPLLVRRTVAIVMHDTVIFNSDALLALTIVQVYAVLAAMHVGVVLAVVEAEAVVFGVELR